MWKHAWLENSSALHKKENEWVLRNDPCPTEMHKGDQMSLCDLLLDNENTFETDKLEVSTHVECDPLYGLMNGRNE